ncbi:antitermination protein NusG [Sedimenticola hydrogenitrophicus]|uniref:antitermination protein NusG n=1 Tax=Sedimenticola hydrogenitrophicus TaxID=2967975 RepID=UPI0021A444BC|nr:antitermination protein NusG [Sedimenticola hydrogenitrophicus]
MFLKLLLTALVIAGALLTLRLRSQRNMRHYRSPARVLNAPADVRQGRRRITQLLAAGTVVLMLVGAGLYLYHQWSDAYQVVTVRVIDTRSARVTTYQAYKGDIDGRTFVTTDDRVVTLAEVERLEIGPE